MGDVRVSDRGAVMLGISAFGGTTGLGCRIQTTTPGASAALAGLASGDEITAVDGTPITSFEDLVDELKEYAVGDTVELAIKRGFAQETVDVKLRGWKEYFLRANGIEPDDEDRDRR